MNFQIPATLASLRIAADNGILTKNGYLPRLSDSICGKFLPNEGLNMELLTVRLEIPEDANLILGQAHFTKTAEDLYEVVVNTVPGAKLGVAFCEASGPCLIRVDSNDDELRQAAISNAHALRCGHVFVLLRFPANLTQTAPPELTYSHKYGSMVL